MKRPSPLDAGGGSQSTWTCFCQICASLAPPALQTSCPNPCGQFICGLHGLPGGWQRESLPLGGGRFVGLPAQQVGAEGKLGVQGQGRKSQAGAKGLFSWCWPDSLPVLYLIYFFIQQVLISHPFYTHQCIHVNPNRPIQHTPTPTPPRLSPLGVRTFVLYICVSTSALQTGSSVPFF